MFTVHFKAVKRFKSKKTYTKKNVQPELDTNSKNKRSIDDMETETTPNVNTQFLRIETAKNGIR